MTNKTTKYLCKEETCSYDLRQGIGITTETMRVFTQAGFSEKERSKVIRYWCPKCGTTVRRKLAEEIIDMLSLKG